jgi:cytochrome c oxidase cbb3-type subunit I/II
MINPRDIVPQSIMPSYAWLATQKLDPSLVKSRMKALKTLGVPYTDLDLDSAENNFTNEAQQIADRLKEQGGGENFQNKEVVALIAYLQSLGKQVEEGQKVSQQ